MTQPEQIIAAIRFDPLLPIWTLAALAAAASLLIVWGFARRARGTTLRAAVFLVLLLWIAAPRLVQETRQGLPDIGLLVVDETASMQIGDRTALAESARLTLQAQASAMPDLELRTITVPESGNDGTKLFAAIDKALADIPRARLAGTIVVTDGQIMDVPPTAPGGAPLHLLLTAHSEETDRRIRLIEAPRYGIVGKTAMLRFIVEDLGTSARTGTTDLIVHRDGQPFLQETAPIGVEQHIEVPITRAGPAVIELAASPLPGEVSQINNRAVVAINGVRDRLRVLLVSGEPHQGERTWRRLLKADPSVDLVHFTILRPPDKDDRTPLNELALIAFPIRELFVDKINEFDLIILDRFQNRGLLPLTYLANIADRVRAGGALLMSVGPEFSGATSLAATPLGSILPAAPARNHAVVEEAFRPEVSDLGQRHPVTAGLTGANPPSDPTAQPTWGSWYRRIHADDVSGEILLKTPDGAPLLTLDHVGDGRTALLLSDQIWLWARGHQGGGPQAELLRRIAHWLMQEPALEENALTAHVVDGILQIEARSTDASPELDVEVTDPDGGTTKVRLQQDKPGQARATLAAPRPGIWRVTQGTRSAFAAANSANPREIADLRVTAALAAPLARQSGGGVHWLGASQLPELRRTEAGNTASGSTWIGLQRRHDHLVIGVAAMDLMPSWLCLPLILGLILAAWHRESR